MLSVKCSREVFELNEKDIIMYNGACYQIITQSIGDHERCTPIIPKTKAQQLIKQGKIVFDKTVDAYTSYYRAV